MLDRLCVTLLPKFYPITLQDSTVSLYLQAGWKIADPDQLVSQKPADLDSQCFHNRDRILYPVFSMVKIKESMCMQPNPICLIKNVHVHYMYVHRLASVHILYIITFIIKFYFEQNHLIKILSSLIVK